MCGKGNALLQGRAQKMMVCGVRLIAGPYLCRPAPLCLHLKQTCSLLVEWEKNMNISARNQLKGNITAIKPGVVTAKVTIDIGGGNSISAVITTDSVEEMDLKPGDAVVAIIKSTEVMIGRE